ncbi:MerR family transcriptional regulator [Niallia nealsonii]|uniref:HTH merR-type domain-containing protein n=1 Tax=Niallia nealsonii TaxID=115979 RepID=A0A2N0Z3G1_9BACI|nr:MerR family transcriptional regulator [Niallia nealsonii]PKG24051.1 hypothetical protein CWS01_08240 [Niallia nealsonii]
MSEKKEMILTENNAPLSVKEAAEVIEESPGVVRNWLRELKTQIPTIVGKHGYRYFDQSGLEVLKKVQQLRRDENLSLAEIADKISPAKTKDVALPFSSNSDTAERILQDLNTIKEQLELQVNFNQVLVQQLKKQQEHIEEQQQFIQSQKQHISALLDTSKREKEDSYIKIQKEKAVETISKKPTFFRLFSYR